MDEVYRQKHIDFMHQAMIQAIGSMEEFNRKKHIDFMYEPMIQAIEKMMNFTDTRTSTLCINQ